MNFNSFFFPAPSDRYSCVSHFGELIYLPKMYVQEEDCKVAKIVHDQPKQATYIPCLMIQQKSLKNPTNLSKTPQQLPIR